MNSKEELLLNLDKIHTTAMGIERILKNLCLETEDVVAWCKRAIMRSDCAIARKGKNWYAQCDDYQITINAYSYTIITAHKV